MQALTPRQVVSLWAELGSLSPIQRTLGLLAAANPDLSRQTLADMPLGMRERMAVELRMRTFGTAWEGTATCPKCHAIHEVQPPVDALLSLPIAEGCTELRLDGYVLTLRLPSSRDQLELMSQPTPERALKHLCACCVINARSAAGLVPVEELPGDVIEAIANRLEELDPAAETELVMTCVECDTTWSVLFEAGTFLWDEVVYCARSLVYQVHALARAYGWSQAEVLGLHPRLREEYLQLAGCP